MIAGTVVRSKDGSNVGYVKTVHGDEMLMEGTSPIVELIIHSEGLKDALDFEQTVSTVAEHMGLDIREGRDYVMSCAVDRLSNIGGSLASNDVFPSYLFYFDLPAVYVSPVWKTLVNVDSLRTHPENIFLASLEPDWVCPISRKRTVGIRGFQELFGEWFAGKIAGIVTHYTSSGKSHPSERTGLVVAPSFDLQAQETKFTLSMGDVLAEVSFADYIPVRMGEVVAVRGDFDLQDKRIITTSLLRTETLEQWTQHS